MTVGTRAVNTYGTVNDVLTNANSGFVARRDLRLIGITANSQRSSSTPSSDCAIRVRVNGSIVQTSNFNGSDMWLEDEFVVDVARGDYFTLEYVAGSTNATRLVATLIGRYRREPQ